MPYAEIERRIQAGIVKREALREAKHPCPCCSAVLTHPLGGGTTCWWECWDCRSFSLLCATWEEALVSTWAPLPWPEGQGVPR